MLREPGGELKKREEKKKILFHDDQRRGKVERH